jgi:hypothetical protein
MVSEKQKSYEFIEKARNLWPPNIEKILEYYDEAESITSDNNHVIYSDKAILFHALGKFENAIKYYDLEKKVRTVHEQINKNRAKALREETIDYVYPWDDQINYFQLKLLHKSSNIFISGKMEFDTILKITRFNMNAILKKFHISKEEFMKELFSNEIQRLELSWIQRIWHHRYNEVKNHPKVNVSKYNCKNLLKNIPKIILMMRLFEIEFFVLITNELTSHDENIAKEVVKIQKLLKGCQKKRSIKLHY